FQENFLITGYRNIAWALAAGMIFNLGNMLFTGTIAVAGMTVAFTVTFAVALAISTAWNLIFEVPSGLLLSLGGVALLLGALVLVAFTYSHHLDAIADAKKRAALQVDPRSKYAKSAPRGSGAAKATTLAVLSGIALGLYGPLLNAAREGDNGVAPYGMVLLFGAGIFVSTIVLAPF